MRQPEVSPAPTVWFWILAWVAFGCQTQERLQDPATVPSNLEQKNVTPDPVSLASTNGPPGVEVVKDVDLRIGPPIPERLLAVPPAPHTETSPQSARAVEADLVLLIEQQSGGPAVEVPVVLVERSKEQPLDLAAEFDGVPLRVRSYSPKLFIEEKIVPCVGNHPGFPALQLRFRRNDRVWEPWLVAGSRLFGRADSQVARVEYLSELAESELVEKEKFLGQLYSPEAKILMEVKRDGRLLILPARAGETHQVSEARYTVRVKRFFNCFGLEMKTGQAVEQDPRPLNPAVEVEIEHSGHSRTAWLFALYPSFSQGAEDESALFRLVYPLPDHPHPRPEMTVVDQTAGPLTLFIEMAGDFHRRTLPPDGVVRLANIELTVPQRIANARVSQSVRPDPSGAPALLLTWKDGEFEHQRWIAEGAVEELRAGKRVLWVRLRTTGTADVPAHPRASKPKGLPASHPSIRGQQ